MEQDTVAMIPARYESTRLPGKLLLEETGKYLIQHVYENIASCDRIREVYVATNSDRISNAVQTFGGEVIRTGEHPSGTDRICEAAREVDAEYIVNVQGDEPTVSCDELHKLLDLLENGWKMGTIATEITSKETFFDPNNVKVVRNENEKAMYFSRAPIPWDRGEFSSVRNEKGKISVGVADPGNETSIPKQGLLHIGIYGFQRDFLLEWKNLPRGKLERLEQLEQLRALEQGVDIGVKLVDSAPIGVDTPEDYQKFLEQYDAS